MEYLTSADFNAVCDSATLDVINQSNVANLDRAEQYAIEEVSSYLRGRYDIETAFAQRGDSRNSLLVMITCDIT